jgi:hypothetical protein
MKGVSATMSNLILSRLKGELYVCSKSKKAARLNLDQTRKDLQSVYQKNILIINAFNQERHEIILRVGRSYGFEAEQRELVNKYGRLFDEIVLALWNYDHRLKILDNEEKSFKLAYDCYNDYVIRCRQRRRDRREIAFRAGVPSSYVNSGNFWVTKNPNGGWMVEFGGQGKPNGPGCGYREVKTNFKLVSQSDPSRILAC